MTRKWELSCLLCQRFESNDLGAIQKHAMHVHGISVAQLRGQSSEIVVPDHFRYSLPGGIAWMDAQRVSDLRKIRSERL